jgi:MFS family permease
VRNLAPYLPPALQKPRVRLYTAGHIVSVLGGWFQQIALSWLVYRLTGSVFLLGLTGFLSQIPYLLLGPFTGTLVDRVSRFWMLVVTDLILAVLALTLTAMAFLDVTDVRAYLLVATLIGIASAFELPARQSLFVALVDDDRSLLPSVIALSAVIYNTGRMIGPALAGALLLVLPEAWCFLINALSFIAIIGALFAMKLPDQMPGAAPRSATKPASFLESVAYLNQLPAIHYLLPMTASLGFFAVTYVHLMPSIADTFFGGSSGMVGLLMSAAGVGALSAAFFLSMQRGTSRQAKLVTIAPFITGIGLIAFALSRWLPLSFLLLALVSCSIMLTTASTNVLVQQSVPDAWRGRAIGLYSMSFQGTAPVGNLIAGALAAWIGLSATLALNGALILIAALHMRRRLAGNPRALEGVGQKAGE